MQRQTGLLRRCVGSRRDGGRRCIILRGDVDRDCGICRQAVARSLSAALVVVVETIAQGDRTRRRLGIIGVGDGLGHTVDLIACDSRGKGQHQRAAAVGVGTNLGAIKFQNITFQVNTGAAASGGAENVIAVGHRIGAVVPGHRQGGADEGVFMTGHQFHIQNRDVAVDDNGRAQHTCLNTLDKGVGRSGIQPTDRRRVVNCSNRNIDRIGSQRVGRTQSFANGSNVCRAAVALGGGIPRPDCQGVADRSVVVRVGLEVDPAIRRCNQESATFTGGRQRGPVGTVVRGVVPDPVRLVVTNDGNAFDRTVVHITDAAD